MKLLAIILTLVPALTFAGNLYVPADAPKERIISIYNGCELIDRGGYFNYADPYCARIPQKEENERGFDLALVPQLEDRLRESIKDRREH